MKKFWIKFKIKIQDSKKLKIFRKFIYFIYLFINLFYSWSRVYFFKVNKSVNNQFFDELIQLVKISNNKLVFILTMQSIVHISHSHMKSRCEIFGSEIKSVGGEVGIIKM